MSFQRGAGNVGIAGKKAELEKELKSLQERLKELQEEGETSEKERHQKREKELEIKKSNEELRIQYEDLVRRENKAKSKGDNDTVKEITIQKNRILMQLLQKRVTKIEDDVKLLEEKGTHLEGENLLLKDHLKEMTFGSSSIPIEELKDDKSFFVLSITNPIRGKCVKLATHQWFDYIILMIIGVNVFFLILDDPQASSDDDLQQVIYYTDIIIVAIFLAEMFIKMIAFGIIFGKHAYLRTGWNVLDFAINVVSVVGLLPDVAKLNAFRTLRVLRAIRAISKLKGLQTLVNSLIVSLTHIANIGLLIIFLFTIFGIFGVQFWQGLFRQTCYIDVNGTYLNGTFYPIGFLPHYDPPNNTFLLPAPHHVPAPMDWNNSWIVDQAQTRLCSTDPNAGYQCSSGTQCEKENQNIMGEGFVNFDNFGWAFLTLFTTMSKNRWAWTMYYAQDSWSSWAWIYFIIFILFCSMFAVNLTIAVIATKFQDVSTEQHVLEERKERAMHILQMTLLTLNPDENEIEAMQQKKNEDLNVNDFESDSYSVEDIEGKLEEEFPLKEDNIEPNDDAPPSYTKKSIWLKMQAGARELVSDDPAKTTKFEISVLCMIILNLVILAIHYYGMSDTFLLVLTIINYLLTAFFVIEMIIKWMAYGIVKYFKNHLNKFDFVVVIAGVVEIVIAAVNGSSTGLIVLRAFRLIRLFKLVSKFKGLNNMLVTVSRAVTSLGYLIVLLVVFILIYSLAGRQLLAGKINARHNYDTFWWSCVTTFQIMTGDDWTLVLYDAMLVSPWFAVYYISLFIVGMYIMISLFIGVLLSKFTMPSSKALKKEEEEKSKALAMTDEKPTNDLNPNGNNTKVDDDTHNLSNIANPMAINTSPPRKRGPSVGLSSIALNIKGGVNLEEPENKKIELHGHSLYIFSPENPFRLFLAKIISHPAFEGIIGTIIVINCIALTLEYPGMPDAEKSVLDILDYIFTAIYIVEMCCKIIVAGFYKEKTAYIKQGWNIPDFLVTILSVIGIIPLFSSVSIIKGLRALRILRLMSRFRGTKVAVMAITRTIPSIGYVSCIVLLFYLIFAIVGMNFFGGQFWTCNDPTVTRVDQCVDYFVQDRQNVSRVWDNPPYSFDNLGSSLLSLFQVATLTGWVDVMYSAVDVNGVDNQPLTDSHPENALYFIVFIIIGSFFSLNLYTSAIIHNFIQETNSGENGSSFSTPEQKEQQKITRIYQSAIPRVKLISPGNQVSQLVFKIVDSTPFDYFISICILLNTVVLAIPFYGMSPVFSAILEDINIAFLAVFALEATLKIIGYGPVYYFGPSGKYLSMTWNKFDFILVLGALALLGINSGPKTIVNAIRVFRVARVLRLVKKLESLNRIFMTFMNSIPSLRNIMSIILVVYFIYAVIGVKLLGSITYCTDYPPSNWFSTDGGINAWANFKDFPNALLTLFRISTLDRWHYLMYTSMGTQECLEDPNRICGQPSNLIFYITFIFIQTYVILNLFLAVLIENFTDFSKSKSGEKDVPLSNFTKFRDAWTARDKNFSGYIDVDQLIPVLLETGPPLGLNQPRKQQVIDELESMNIHMTPDEKVEFEEVLSIITLRTAEVDLKLNREPSLLDKNKPVVDFFRVLYEKYKNKKKESRNEFDEYMAKHRDVKFLGLSDSESIDEDQLLSMLESSTTPEDSENDYNDSDESSGWGSLVDRTSSSSDSDSKGKSKAHGMLTPRSPRDIPIRRVPSSKSPRVFQIKRMVTRENDNDVEMKKKKKHGGDEDSSSNGKKKKKPTLQDIVFSASE